MLPTSTTKIRPKINFSEMLTIIMSMVVMSFIMNSPKSKFSSMAQISISRQRVETLEGDVYHLISPQFTGLPRWNILAIRSRSRTPSKSEEKKTL